MSGGYGGGGYGSMPYGGTIGAEVYHLIAAIPWSPYGVEIRFSNDIDLVSNPKLDDTASYTIVGLAVIAAYIVSSRSVWLRTSKQQEGTSYNVHINPDPFPDSYGDALGIRDHAFTGVGALTAFVVNSLMASTMCEGNGILLSWKNPTGTLHTKIVRRSGSFPFDLIEDHTVIHDGDVIEEYEDRELTGGHALDGQTYYYYLVLASPVEHLEDADYSITDDSKEFALSISDFSSKDFYWNNTPVDAKRLDKIAVEDGGGGGYLDKIYSVLGCWLNLMRGYANAIRLMTDDDKAPFFALRAKSLSMGTDTEGDAYSYAIARKQLLSQKYIYRRRGTCSGGVQAIRMFSLWDATCAEVGLATECNKGSSSFKTWDGRSCTSRLDSKVIHTTFLGENGEAKIEIVGESLTPGQWNEGRIYGSLGDIACVDTNDATYIYTKGVTKYTDLTATPVPDSFEISVASTLGLYPGMTIQLTGLNSLVPGSYIAEISDIVSVDHATKVVTLLTPILNTYTGNPILSLGKSFIRDRMKLYVTLEDAGPGGTYFANVPGALWVDDQWNGYHLKIGPVDSAFDVVDTQEDMLIFDPNYYTYGLTTIYLAKSMTFSPFVPLCDIILVNGAHSLLLDTVWDVEMRGTRYDPFFRLYQGPGLSLMGTFGPTDVAMYILSQVVRTIGKSPGATGGVMTIDPMAPPVTENELAGYYLNPNQNQWQSFEIISNTTTTITVRENIQDLVVPTQYYWILSAKDRNKYATIHRRLNKEFMHQDVSTKILFV
jgi:hypothetical protein